jgi:hypothetical protein
MVDRMLILDGDKERWWHPVTVDRTPGAGAVKQGRGESQGGERQGELLHGVTHMTMRPCPRGVEACCGGPVATVKQRRPRSHWALGADEPKGSGPMTNGPGPF